MAREGNRLSDELKEYGYVFSVKRTLVQYALMCLGMFFLGRFFGLLLIPQLILFGAGMALLPFLVRNAYRNRYYQQKFSDLNVYMEQFLYSFLKTRKVLTTLEDTAELFEAGEMKETIEEARDHILYTYHETDFQEKGLSIIEKKYPYPVLSMMHRFALRTEEIGGECKESVELLLSARRMWADRIFTLQQEKKVKRREVVMSIVTSLLLCSVIYYMAGKMHLDVATHPLAQTMTIVVLILDLLIYYRADKKLTAGYLATKEKEEQTFVKQYRRIKQYGNGPLDRIGKQVAIRSVTRELKAKFPEWLMQLSLFMQSENVAVAIFKSYETAPEILKEPLSELIGRIKMNPGDRRAYMDFLSDFTLPEVKSTMKMLLAIAEGNGGDERSQIADIIRRNQKMQDEANRQKDKDSLAGMYALFLAPQLTGGLKLVVDMILLFIVYLGQMGTGTM